MDQSERVSEQTSVRRAGTKAPDITLRAKLNRLRSLSDGAVSACPTRSGKRAAT